MAATKRQVRSLAMMFRVLSDPTRLRVLMSLRKAERNVSEICLVLRMPQPTVSRHLGILRMAGLVNNRRNGKAIYYSLPRAARRARLLQTVLQAAGGP